MTVKLGVVMDPIETINFHKDSSLAMLLAAQARGWELYYMEQDDLFLRDSDCHAQMCRLEVRADPQDWFTRAEPETRPLASLDVVLMRKDPPFDMEYVHTTYLLEQAETRGTLVVNRPSALDRRSAISGLTALRLATTRAKVDAATPRFSANDLMLMSNGLIYVSRINSPGCGGLCIAINDSPRSRSRGHPRRRTRMSASSSRLPRSTISLSPSP